MYSKEDILFLLSSERDGTPQLTVTELKKLAAEKEVVRKATRDAELLELKAKRAAWADQATVYGGGHVHFDLFPINHVKNFEPINGGFCQASDGRYTVEKGWRRRKSPKI